MLKKTLTTLIIALVFSLTVLSDTDAADFYIGAACGGTEIENDIVPIGQEDQEAVRFEERDLAYKFFTGCRLNDYIGIEVIYADFGKIRIHGNAGKEITSGGKMWTFLYLNTETKIHVRTIAVGVTLSLPLKKFTDNAWLKRITPFCMIGGHYWDIDMSISPANGVDQMSMIRDDNDVDFFYGAGLQIDLISDLSMRLEYNFYNCRKVIVEDAEFVGISLIYTF